MSEEDAALAMVERTLVRRRPHAYEQKDWPSSVESDGCTLCRHCGLAEAAEVHWLSREDDPQRGEIARFVDRVGDYQVEAIRRGGDGIWYRLRKLP